MHMHANSCRECCDVTGRPPLLPLHIGDCSDSTLRSGAGFLLSFLPNERHAQSSQSSVDRERPEGMGADRPRLDLLANTLTKATLQQGSSDSDSVVRYGHPACDLGVLEPPSSYIPPIVVLLQTRATWRVFTTQHTGKVATLLNSSNWSRTPTR